MQQRTLKIKRLKRTELFGVQSRRSPNSKPPVFEHAEGKRLSVYRAAVKNAGHTWNGRYNLLDSFLWNNRDKIKTFADIGAANVVGAPTTADARRYLGPQAAVYAVDRKLSPGNLAWKGIEQLKHRITKAPLPFLCDAIRLANVSPYLAEEDFVRALDNIWHSLKPRGFLLSAGPMEPMGRPRDVSSYNERVLVKVRKTKRNPFGFAELKLLDEQGRYLH